MKKRRNLESEPIDHLVMALNTMIERQPLRDKLTGRLFVLTGIHQDGSLLLTCISEPLEQAWKVSRLDGFEKVDDKPNKDSK